jgi:DNA polymerase III subunit beta
MRITIPKQDLLEAIQIVIGAVGVKNTLPILSHILIEADSQTLKLTTTDLDIGISYTQPIKTIETGQTTVPAKRFYDIVKELPQGDIKITTKKNNTMLIESKNAIFKILTIPHDEFPAPPKILQKEELILGQGILKDMLQKTTFAMSREETRYVLNGVCLEVEPKHIHLIATDGRRLALIKHKCDTNIKEHTTLIIPTKTTQELLKILKEEGDVKIRFTKNQIMFQTQRICIISRLIEGEFPDYKQAIPGKTETKLIINRENLMAAIKRASLLTTLESQAIILHPTPKKLVITKTTPEVGEATEDVEAQYAGPDIQIGFNPYYLLDVLKVVSDEYVEMELIGPDKPGVLRVKEDYLYIVLPMQII